MIATKRETRELRILLVDHFNVLAFLAILSILFILSSTPAYRALFNKVKFGTRYSAF